LDVRLIIPAFAATQIYARLDLDPVRHALDENAKLMFGDTGAAFDLQRASADAGRTAPKVKD
jgi:hypothetical protein